MEVTETFHSTSTLASIVAVRTCVRQALWARRVNNVRDSSTQLKVVSAFLVIRLSYSFNMEHSEMSERRGYVVEKAVLYISI